MYHDSRIDLERSGAKLMNGNVTHNLELAQSKYLEGGDNSAESGILTTADFKVILNQSDLGILVTNKPLISDEIKDVVFKLMMDSESDFECASQKTPITSRLGGISIKDLVTSKNNVATV
jgi:hypothetical protein